MVTRRLVETANFPRLGRGAVPVLPPTERRDEQKWQRKQAHSGQPFSGSTEKADEKQNIQRRDYRPEKNESDNEQRAVSVPAHHLCG